MTKPIKLKWTVEPAITGPYRSFFKREWPSADYNGEHVASIRCKDGYHPNLVKTGEHAELEVWVAIRKPGKPVWEKRRLSKRAATLAEAKELAAKFFEANPQCLGDIAATKTGD